MQSSNLDKFTLRNIVVKRHRHSSYHLCLQLPTLVRR